MTTQRIDKIFIQRTLCLTEVKQQNSNILVRMSAIASVALWIFIEILVYGRAGVLR